MIRNLILYYLYVSIMNVYSFTAWQGGDPHITTLDGLSYTFNGLGEYVMINASNGTFVLQVCIHYVYIYIYIYNIYIFKN